MGKKRFEISELKKILGLINKKGEEQFTEITAFKKFVLEIAKKQINENTDIQFDYELMKKGRAYHWITIHMNTQKFKQLEINFEKPLEMQKFAGKLRTYGFTEEQASIISEKVKESEFDTLVNELNKKVRQNKLSFDNAIAYLVGVYQKKGILPRKNK